MVEAVEWIAVDWGTSRLRVWAMNGGSVVDEAQSEHGISRLNKDQMPSALMSLVCDWLGPGTVQVLACGMVGARQGWVEASYTAVPAEPLPVQPIMVPGTDARINAYVVPGLKQLHPADVMRGEETQIAGFLKANPNWDGVICLPGTHTKWAHISAGEVVSFRTFMTGELFDLLSSQSVLKHSMGEGWDDTVFADAVSDTMSRPEGLAAGLFGIRARDLLEGREKDIARSRLSGALIGAELAAARPYWLGQQLVVIATPGISGVYAQALRQQGCVVDTMGADKATLAGLAAARALLED